MKKLFVVIVACIMLSGCAKKDLIDAQNIKGATIEKDHPPFSIYDLSEEETNRVIDFINDMDRSKEVENVYVGDPITINLKGDEKDYSLSFLDMNDHYLVGFDDGLYQIEDLVVDDIIDKYMSNDISIKDVFFYHLEDLKRDNTLIAKVEPYEPIGEYVLSSLDDVKEAFIKYTDSLKHTDEKIDDDKLYFTIRTSREDQVIEARFYTDQKIVFTDGFDEECYAMDIQDYTDMMLEYDIAINDHVVSLRAGLFDTTDMSSVVNGLDVSDGFNISMIELEDIKDIKLNYDKSITFTSQGSFLSPNSDTVKADLYEELKNIDLTHYDGDIRDTAPPGAGGPPSTNAIIYLDSGEKITIEELYGVGYYILLTDENGKTYYRDNYIGDDPRWLYNFKDGLLERHLGINHDLTPIEFTDDEIKIETIPVIDRFITVITEDELDDRGLKVDQKGGKVPYYQIYYYSDINGNIFESGYEY